MPAVYDHPHTVLDGEIDALGHANNLHYLKWTQTAAIAHSAAQGWPGDAYVKLGSGWIVRSHHIEYLRPALAGDELAIRTWVATFKRVSSLRRYHIIRRQDNRLLARAATDWVFVSYATGMPTRVPKELQQAFEIMGDDPPEAGP